MIFKANSGLTGIIILIMIFISSCKEDPPYIDFSIPDETLLDTAYIDTNLPTPQNKIVLIEEFTGIDCYACPSGHQELAKLDSSYQGLLNIVGIHEGTFAKPKPGYFDINLTTDAGKAIGSIFGGIPGIFPSALIDRVEFSGEYYDSSPGSWENKVFQRLSNSDFPLLDLKKTSVNLTVSNVSFDDQTRVIKAKIGLHYTEDVSTSHYLSVLLIEDSIVTPQNMGNDIWEYDYIQRHVLRGMLSSFQGEALTESLVSGRVFEKEYKLELDTDWNEAQCHIIAIVHHSGDSSNVVQTASGHISH